MEPNLVFKHFMVSAIYVPSLDVLVTSGAAKLTPAIGDKAHQPSLFKATTFLPIFTKSAAPVRPHMAELTELEIK